MLRIRQGVLAGDIELVKLNTVQEHIDAAEIVRSQVYLLPEVAHGHTLIAQNLLCFQKE